MNTIKKMTLTATLSFFLVASLAVLALAAPQTTCPVMGGKINKQLYVDYKGQRVYFCCMACPAEFKKNPEKYLQKLKDMGQEPEQLDKTSK